MQMQRTLTPPDRTHDALVAFLDSHVGAAFRDDVGPLLGQASLIRDSGFADADVQHYWNDAVSAAVSSEAVCEQRGRAKAIRRSLLPNRFAR